MHCKPKGPRTPIHGRAGALVAGEVYDRCMCGRYTLVRGDKIVQVVPNVTMPANLRIVGRFNVAPSQLVPVIANNSGAVQMFRWGLIPSWAKDPKIGNKLINARAETLTEKPAFKRALARRRCLIPADGFYEWRKEDAGGKTPMYIQMRDEAAFAFAGLWETWQDPAGDEIYSVTIITTEPNELLKSVHNRMPVILPREAYEGWLTPGEVKPEELTGWLKPYPAGAMKMHAVGTGVNSPGREGRELIEEAPEKPREAPIPVRRGTKKPEQPSLFD